MPTTRTTKGTAWRINLPRARDVIAELGNRSSFRLVRVAAGTRVQLEHLGFEAYGDKRGQKARDGYNGGWPGVLGRFADRAARRRGTRPS